MGDAGLFADTRVELLNGTVIEMSPQNSPHASTVARLQRALVRAIGDAAHLRTQLPIILDDWSEPEPDVVVCRPEPHDYLHTHPRASEVLLVCEVGESSLAYDRSAKAAAYAGSGIPEYWVVDVDRRVIEVHREPDVVAGRYRRTAVVTGGARLAVPGGASVDASDVLPPS